MGKAKSSSLSNVKQTSSSKELAKEQITHIRDLERKVCESQAHWKSISNIVACYSDDQPDKIVYAAIHSLQRIFQRFLEKGTLSTTSGGSANDAKAAATPQQHNAAWLKQVYRAYIDRLLQLLQHHADPALQVPALKLLLTFLQPESKQLHQSSEVNTFANALYLRILASAFVNEHWNAVLANACVEYINMFDDLRFYFYKNMVKILEQEIEAHANEQQPQSKSNSKKRKADSRDGASAVTRLQWLSMSCFSVIEGLTSFPKKDADLGKCFVVLDGPASQKPKKGGSEAKRQPANVVLQAAMHKRAFTDFIITYLRLPYMTTPLYKKLLLLMHKKILPNLADPKLLMDFLTASYNIGGSVSLLALHSVFTLIQHHNLDYPDFYTKLYNLFDRSLMHVKYRSRFFRLVELFLRSTHIPAYLIAAFIKRMSRLSLHAPPSAILLAIPFIYNLLQQHPQCMVLIHRADAEPSAAAAVSADPFDFDEMDPAKCRAMDSSLWELQTLKSHYFANIATLAQIFEQKFTKERYDLEDFYDYSYASLFEASVVKHVRKEPALNFDISPSLFTSNELTAELFDV
ncbi:Maturation and nuclear export of 40S ribosomal subunits interacting protein [Sorochytrium milnesiophthora]